MSGFAGNSRRTGPLAIAIVCMSQFMVILDVTIVVIALPAIRDGLAFSDAGLQWVFTAYTLVFVALAIALLVLPADKKSTEQRHLDLGGALTVTASLALLVYRLTSAGDRGLARLLSWLPLLLATVTFMIFIRHEERTADPLLPLRLLRSLPVAGANLTALAITASTSSAMYLAVMYVQRVLGIPAGQASLLFPAVNLAAIVGALLSPRLLGRFGARRSLLAGFATITVGITLLVALPTQGLPVVQLLARSHSSAQA